MSFAHIKAVAHSEPADLATAISSMHLFGSLGSSICLALSAATTQHILHSQLRLHLEERDTDLIDELIQRIASSLDDVKELSSELQTIVRNSYEIAVEWSLFVCLCFATFALLSSLLIKEKKFAAGR